MKFYARREELTTIKGCVFYGDRIVVPKRYHDYILSELHQGHPGVARMKLLARSKVYWPSIDEDVENLVKRCESRAINAKSPVKCTWQSWPIAKRPWSRVHVDFTGPVNGFWYLVVIDAFSKWPETFKMQSITASKTIDLPARGIFVSWTL